jgi:hypothetical protein
MTDAPDKIYAWESADDCGHGGWSLTDDWEATSKTEYTRTDISQARIAELEDALALGRKLVEPFSGKHTDKFKALADKALALKAKP